MNFWLKIFSPLFLSSFLHGATINEALDEVKQSSSGFVLFDLGISSEDLALFNSIDIQREWVYHQFGELEKIEESIVKFIDEIGCNERGLALHIASRLKEITDQVIQSSGKQTGWACLRSFTPTNRFDIPRWHVDGPYYIPNGPKDLIFKVVVTLVGPSTLFYPLSPDLRKLSENALHNRPYMKNFCKKENIVSPNLGEGALFRAGRYTALAALHSEPPIHENRIFFSIVPCSEEQLPDLKTRVTGVYPKNSSQ